MAESLYPTFSIPTITIASAPSAPPVWLKPCPLFDFEEGDFVRDGANRVVMVNGNDSYILWVIKALKTQKSACLSYIHFGMDRDGALAESGRAAVQSAVERAITDALLRHRATERVYDFAFEWNGDTVGVSFTVKPQGSAAFGINVEMA